MLDSPKPAEQPHPVELVTEHEHGAHLLFEGGEVPVEGATDRSTADTKGI